MGNFLHDRIAVEVGCSTTVLYTMFGGKPGVAEGLWREGFDRLRQAMERVQADAPLGRLAALGHAYRANALANRAYYAVMFQRPIPGFEPSADAYADSLRPLRILVDAVADCIRAGVLRPADPAHVAGVLWAAAHGAVSLELAGYEGASDAQARFQSLAARELGPARDHAREPLVERQLVDARSPRHAGPDRRQPVRALDPPPPSPHPAISNASSAARLNLPPRICRCRSARCALAMTALSVTSSSSAAAGS